MEKETKETTTTTTTTNTETVENKKGGSKSRSLIVIICLVVLVAAGVGAYFFITNQADTPEKIAEKYVAAMTEGNADKILEITDLKGAYAWDKCGKDASKFVEEYNKTSDSDINSYKDELKTSLNSAMAMLKAFGGVNISLKNIENPSELDKGLYSVKANMQMEAFGMQQDQSITLVTYNGKYIGEMSK